MSPLTENEIELYFAMASRGEPCHLCGSPYGFRIVFMGQCAHHKCVQALCREPGKECNKHGAYES